MYPTQTRLGSHVAEALLEKGYEVAGVVRPRSNLRNVAAFQSKVQLTRRRSLKAACFAEGETEQMRKPA